VFSVIPYRSKTAKYCCYRCHQIGEGRKGGKVRGEQRKKESKGVSYKKINGRHAHRVIMEEFLGRTLNSNEVVHHIDGDKFNNHIDNLKLTTQSEHIKLHIKEMLKKRKDRHNY